MLVVLAVAGLVMDRPRPTAAYAAQVPGRALLALAIVLARRTARGRTSWPRLLLFVLVAVDFRTASAAVVSVPATSRAMSWTPTLG